MRTSENTYSGSPTSENIPTRLSENSRLPQTKDLRTGKIGREGSAPGAFH
jgi:hypothetical protein